MSAAVRPPIGSFVAFATAGLLLGALGCGPSPEQSVRETTRHFWSALRANDLDGAAEVALPIARERLEAFASARPLEAVELHEVLLGETAAVVETTLPGSDPGDPLRFLTYLVRLEDGWRVDMDRTETGLRATALARGYRDAEDSIRESSRAIGEAIARGARGAALALEEAIEALEEELSRDPGDVPPPPAPSEPPVEQKPTERRL